jgi:uncharacterized oxidoreductase
MTQEKKMKLNNNVIVITGGASGIGYALAKKLSEFDNQVIITGRNEEKLQAAAKQIKNCEYVVCDVSRQEQIEKLSMILQEKYPRFNILINNAGVQFNYYLKSETNPYSRIEDEININLKAPVKLSAILLPQLMMQEEAAIVNVTSSLALVPKENAAVYCASKAALHSFTKTLRYQCEDSAVKVFELIPPLVDTSMTKGRGVDKISAEEVAEEFVQGFKNNRPEIWIGKAKLVKTIFRIAPALIEKKMRKAI